MDKISLVLNTVMGAARQLIRGTTADKLAYLMKHLPQKIEDGQLVNYIGEPMGEIDLEDQELVKVERLSESKQITDKLLTDIFHPINTIVYEKEVKDVTIGDAPKPVSDDKGEIITGKDKKDSKSEELADLEIQLIKAIKKGKNKKASILLKELNKSDTLKKKAWKKYKKQIEGL